MTTQKLLAVVEKTHNGRSTRVVRVGGTKLRAYSGLIQFDATTGEFQITLEGKS